MVFTKRDGDVASAPVSIHRYIRMLEESQETSAECAVGVAAVAGTAAVEANGLTSGSEQ